MGNFGLVHPVVGLVLGPSAPGVTPVSLAVPTWDTVQRHPVGTIIQGNDVVSSNQATFSGNFGLGEFIYCKWPTASTMPVWSLVNWTVNYTLVAMPSTANLGTPVGVLAWAGLVSSTTAIPSYGWVQIAGMCPAAATATVAANAPVGIGTSAGTVSGTIAAGKDITGMVGSVASAGTLVKTNVTTVSGSATLYFPNTDGLYVGSALSGTGIGASALVGYIFPDGHTVNATVVSTASGVVSVTQTNTGYILVSMNRPSTVQLT